MFKVEKIVVPNGGTAQLAVGTSERIQIFLLGSTLWVGGSEAEALSQSVHTHNASVFEIGGAIEFWIYNGTGASQTIPFVRASLPATPAPQSYTVNY